MSHDPTDQSLWTAVDQYISERAVRPDAALDAALADSAAAGLPAINVAPNQGKLLMLLARLCGARSILEIGTLGGYSTIWLARGLAPGGRLTTLEAEARHAEVARANIERAGLSPVVELRLGPALETLPRLAEEGRGPFDFIFIDADKPPTADYFDWAIRLARPGSLIVVDNVVRRGAIARDPASLGPDISAEEQANVAGVKRFHELLATDSRVTATAIQTVGQKGYDGLALAIVNGA